MACFVPWLFHLTDSEMVLNIIGMYADGSDHLPVSIDCFT